MILKEKNKINVFNLFLISKQKPSKQWTPIWLPKMETQTKNNSKLFLYMYIPQKPLSEQALNKIKILCIFTKHHTGHNLLEPNSFMYSFQKQQKPHLTKAGIRAQQYQTQGCFEIKTLKSAQEEKEEEGEAQESEEGIPSVELTAAAVKDHNKFCEEAKGMTVGQFELALAKMDAKASMRLWKAFEVQRKSAGEEEGYQSATSKGTGSLKKKRQLLFGWIKDGGKTGEHYRTWMDTVSLKKSKGLTETWLTTHQALAHWGPEGLKERVKTGSIVTRKDPSDKNFWQFRALTETAKTEVERVKTTGVSSKSKAKVEALQALGQLEGLEALTEEDFVPGVESGSEDVEEDGELPAGLAKALGGKVKKEKKEKKEKEEKEDKWDTMSQVKVARSYRTGWWPSRPNSPRTLPTLKPCSTLARVPWPSLCRRMLRKWCKKGKLW